MSQISQQATAEVFGQEGGGFLARLTISHDDLAEPIRVVDNTVNLWKSAPSVRSFDRNSAKWVVDASGVWSEFAADVEGVTDLGINLIGGAVNGSANNGLAGAVAGSPGTVPTGWGSWVGNGVTRQSVAFATDHGLPCIDIECGGTPTTGTSIAAALGRTGVNAWPVTPGDTIVGSCFLAVIGGAFVGLSNFLRLTYYDAAGANLTQVDIPINTLGSTLTRVDTGPRVVPALAAYANVQIRIGFTVGVPYNIKFRIGAPQVELNVLTPPMISTGTTTTRVADALTLELSSTVADLVVTFDDDSTQTFPAVSGSYPIDPAVLNRPNVKRFTHAYERWDWISDVFVNSRGGDMFIAFPFELTLPNDQADSVPKAQLTIDNVSREIAQLIRSITTPAIVTIEVVRIYDFDDVEVTLPDFQLRNVEWDALTVTGDLVLDDDAQEQVPQRKFTPSEYPGLF